MITVPISLGELVDKLTILKIKKDKISDPDKLANVVKEYDLLIDILHEHQLGEDHELFQELYRLNLAFWEYHDWQRERWTLVAQLPDDHIDTELYRKTREEHLMNDQRAEIKKRINTLYRSEIVEEKQFKGYGIWLCYIHLIL